MIAMTDQIAMLETERLDLRGPTAADLDSYLAFNAVSDITVGTYRGGRSQAEVLKWLENDIAHWRANGFGMWLLTMKGSKDVLGGVGLSHPKDWPSHELTWWLMPKARGQGIASEASRAAISFGYETLGWPTVETHMRDENMPARRLAERLGGTIVRRETFPDGVTRDVFALPKEKLK